MLDYLIYVSKCIVCISCIIIVIFLTVQIIYVIPKRNKMKDRYLKTVFDKFSEELCKELIEEAKNEE